MTTLWPALAHARDPLSVSVTINQKDMKRRYGSRTETVAQDTAGVLGAYLRDRCPFAHWQIINNRRLTTALEFSIDDEAGDVVLRVKAVADGKHRHTWSVPWQHLSGFVHPHAGEASAKLAEVFESLLIKDKWREISRALPLSAGKPVWRNESQVVLPLSFEEHEDLSHGVFRLDCQWYTVNGDRKEPHDVSIFVRSDGATDDYPAVPSYLALAAEGDKVRYQNRFQDFASWRSKVQTLTYLQLVLDDPGDRSQCDP
jgi:hypothetical protein